MPPQYGFIFWLIPICFHEAVKIKPVIYLLLAGAFIWWRAESITSENIKFRQNPAKLSSDLPHKAPLSKRKALDLPRKLPQPRNIAVVKKKTGKDEEKLLIAEHILTAQLDHELMLDYADIYGEHDKTSAKKPDVPQKLPPPKKIAVVKKKTGVAKKKPPPRRLALLNRSIRPDKKLSAIDRRVLKIEQKVRADNINKLLRKKKLRRGMPVFIRIFKQSYELEVWMKKGGRYRHLKTYPICYWSGRLGPKISLGDRQSPEGFYSVSFGQLNANSKYYKALNLGFPNRYDRAHQRTGKHLMVHGKCNSDGCYAMTNAGIHEIYALAESALRNGQRKFEVHVFPFRMTRARMKLHRKNRWHGFWTTLKKGYDWFEKHRNPPKVSVISGRYLIADAS